MRNQQHEVRNPQSAAHRRSVKVHKDHRLIADDDDVAVRRAALDKRAVQDATEAFNKYEADL